MLCNQDCYDMMLLWDSLLLRSKGFGNTASSSAPLLIGRRLVLVCNICMRTTGYVSLCLAGLLKPRTAASIFINGTNNYEK